MQRRLYRVGTSALCLGKTEIVVRGDVERARALACELLGGIVVLGGAVEDNNGAPCDAGDGLGEAIIDAALEATSVERVKVRVERRVALCDMSELSATKSYNAGRTL